MLKIIKENDGSEDAGVYEQQEEILEFFNIMKAAYTLEEIWSDSF